MWAVKALLDCSNLSAGELRDVKFFDASGGQVAGTADVAVLSIDLAPMENQIWMPARS
jgi:hypothetical protein